MGAVHSRRVFRPAAAKNSSNRRRNSSLRHDYLILNFEFDRIKVVNAEKQEIYMIEQIIKKHRNVKTKGWESRVIFLLDSTISSAVKICIFADIFLGLTENGWTIRRPTDVGLSSQKDPTTTLCFTMNTESKDVGQNSTQKRSSYICFETFNSDCLAFHNVSHTLLLDIVSSLQKDLPGCVLAVSREVHSVICDYVVDVPPVINSHSPLRDKFIRLKGNPWTNEDTKAVERLQMCLVACLIQRGFKICMDFNLERSSRIFFFTLNSKDTSEEEVLVPDMSSLIVNEGNRPVAFSSKASFYRRYKEKSLCLKMLKHSLKRKVSSSKQLWWQQKHIEMI